MSTSCEAVVTDCTEAGLPTSWQTSESKILGGHMRPDRPAYQALILNTLDGHVRHADSNAEHTGLSHWPFGSADSVKPYQAPTMDYRPIVFDHDKFIPLQRWEGTVVAVSDDEFVARLRDMTNPGVDEEAILPVEDISTDDRDLLEPGAMFYLNLGYHITTRGQRIRGMKVRMRRLPKWAADEVLDARSRGRKILDRIVECD